MGYVGRTKGQFCCGNVMALVRLDTFLYFFVLIHPYISQWTIYLMPTGIYDNYYGIFTVFLSLHS